MPTLGYRSSEFFSLWGQSWGRMGSGMTKRIPVGSDKNRDARRGDLLALTVPTTRLAENDFRFCGEQAMPTSSEKLSLTRLLDYVTNLLAS